MKFKYIVVYENNSDKLEIGHCRTKVKVMARIFSPFTAIQTVRSHNCELYISAPDHVRKLRLSSIVHLTSIKKLFYCFVLIVLFKSCHA